MGPLFRGGHSPSSIVNNFRAVFSLRSDSISKDRGDGNPPPNVQHSVKSLQAAEQLGRNDSHSQDGVFHPKADQMLSLEG